MDNLCNALLSCKIEYKPILYDMMIFDFVELSKQYSNNCFQYTFGVNPDYEVVDSDDIEELGIYIQQSKCENILQQIIEQRYPLVHIDSNIISSMIDYYIECLFTSL